MDTTRLTRITPRVLARAIGGTSERWWERRLRRLLELRDEEGRPIAVKIGRRYLADWDRLVEAILAGKLDEHGAA